MGSNHRFGRAGAKYRAVRVFVTADGTQFTHDDLVRLARAAQEPTTAFVKHRAGAPTVRPLTMRELAAAVQLDGESFDSKMEADHYAHLLMEAKAGVIRNLRRQVPYELHAPGGKVVGRYIADFVFEMDGATVVQDVKGYRTQLFQRTKKHVEAEWGVTIVEISP